MKLQKTEGKPVLGTSMTTNNGNQESYAKNIKTGLTIILLLRKVQK